MNDLIHQLNEWHDDDEHENIINAIKALPESQRTYQIESLYARALNNLDREADALQVLLSVQEQGKDDPLWYFRVGYALYYLNRSAEAVPYFEKAIALGDDNSNTEKFLAAAKQEAKEQRRALARKSVAQRQALYQKGKGKEFIPHF